MRLFGLIVLILFSLSGCSKSPEPEDSIVKVISSCSSNDIIITDIKGRKRADGFMQAQVSAENKSGSYQVLEYRIVWFDKDGFKIESILSKWNTVPAYAQQPFHINATSPSTKATTFRLYIKKEKEIICEEQYDGH